MAFERFRTDLLAIFFREKNCYRNMEKLVNKDSLSSLAVSLSTKLVSVDRRQSRGNNKQQVNGKVFEIKKRSIAEQSISLSLR